MRQTRTDWRLLIVVHAERAQHFSELLRESLADERVRLIIRTGRLLAGAYNSAMRAAETEFIAPLLGDDLWSLDAVEVLTDSIRAHPEVDFFHSGRRFIDGAGRSISSEYLPDRPVTVDAFLDAPPVKHLLCWRVRTGLACGGVDETLNNHGSDDYDFPWTMLEHGAQFRAIPKALYLFRDHRDGYRLTTHVPRNVQIETLRRILTKHRVSEERIQARLRKSRRSYLRQSLFRNEFHRWILERLGFDANRGWRESYR